MKKFVASLILVFWLPAMLEGASKESQKVMEGGGRVLLAGVGVGVTGLPASVAGDTVKEGDQLRLLPTGGVPVRVPDGIHDLVIYGVKDMEGRITFLVEPVAGPKQNDAQADSRFSPRLAPSQKQSGNYAEGRAENGAGEVGAGEVGAGEVGAGDHGLPWWMWILTSIAAIFILVVIGIPASHFFWDTATELYRSWRFCRNH